MPVTLFKTPRNITEYARSVANDIASLGHYKFNGPDHYSTYNPEGKCCIYINPTSRYVLGDHPLAWPVQGAFEDALRERIAPLSIVQWSDQTPTAEVLHMLRSF